MSRNSKPPTEAPRDWKTLRVGDRIRIIAVPLTDQKHFDDSGDNETYQVLRQLVDTRSVCTIEFIDSTGYPWITCHFRNPCGELEEHGLAIWDNESWEMVTSRE